MTRSIHRIIELHAATNGGSLAVIDAESACSYRDLNTAANALARRLMTEGFRRGMRAHVSMAPSGTLAAALLAILKAGGCYTWSKGSSTPSLRVEEAPGMWRDLEFGDLTVNGVCGGPNLPVIARGTDIACVLDHHGVEKGIAVPHATIISMASCAGAGAGRSPWTGESGAFDLWAALLSGATAVVTDRSAVAA